MVNDALRQEVTKVGFQLSLSRTQVEALAWFEMVVQYENENPGRSRHRTPRMWVTAIHRLVDKGLIVHYWPPRNAPGPPYMPDTYGLKDCYELTLAGTLVIGLLSEAGILQEEMERLRGLEAAR